MANEAVIIELLGNAGNPVRFTVADATGISKGVLCKLTDPRTAAAASADGDAFAGIAATDKEAGDGATTLALYTKGIFDLRFDGGSSTVSAGYLVKISGANLIAVINDGVYEARRGTVGKALESAATGTAETIAVAVGVY